jgi:hypothetical protein
MKNAHSYSLDAIGEYELNERKTQFEGTLDQLYNQHFKKFIEYNRQDTLLLHKLDRKLQFLIWQVNWHMPTQCYYKPQWVLWQ